MCIGHTWIWYSVLTNHVCICYMYALGLIVLRWSWQGPSTNFEHRFRGLRLMRLMRLSWRKHINRALNLNETVDPRPILLETDQARLECSKLLIFEVWTFGWTSFRKFPSIPRKSSNYAFNVAKCIFFFDFLTGSDKTPGGQTLSGGATYAVASSRGPVANEETKTVNVLPFAQSPSFVPGFVALRKGNGEGKTSMGRTVTSSPTHYFHALGKALKMPRLLR